MNVWKDSLTLKPYELPSGKVQKFPLLFIELGGPVTKEKIQLANNSVIEWMRKCKKKVMKKNDKYQWYQPVTQNQHLRTFFGAMKNMFLWEMDLDDFNFEGSIAVFLFLVRIRFT